MESERALLQRIAHVTQRLGDKLNTLQDECDRLSARYFRCGGDQFEWNETFNKSEELRLRYVRMREFYLKTAVRFAARCAMQWE